MATISVRGIDDKTIARLKRQAKAEGTSLNSLVVGLLEGECGHGRRVKQRLVRKHDDLDALAGTWDARQAADFERATAVFSEVDAALWK